MENKHWICLCISYTIELYFYYHFNSIEKGILYPMALFQSQNLRSNEVHRKVSVNVLLPVDSHAQHPAGERFRTLYLFHGVTDNNMAWLLNTRLYELAEKYNLCVVLPSGENSFYMNREDRFECWENFFCQELPLLMQRACPLSDRREDTFIGGLDVYKRQVLAPCGT